MIGKTEFPPLYFCYNLKKIAYLRINKNACSSLARLIAELKGPVQSPLWDERNFDLVTRDFEQISDYIKFTMVRNPYDRFLSFYKNWIINPPHERVLDHYQKFGLYKDMSLDECVQKVVRINKFHLEAHLRPQSEFVFTGDRMNVNMIGKVERMEQDLLWICAGLGIENKAAHQNKSSPSSALTLSMRHKKMLHRYYEMDFSLFQYDPEIKLVKPRFQGLLKKIKRRF